MIFFSGQVLLYINGSAIYTFPNTLIGKGCYIGVKHRNSLETWSRPVTLSSGMSYDFTTANSQSCGDNMILVDVSPDVWAIRQGDVNQDGKIDATDSLAVVSAFGATGYRPEDLNCDGMVDTNDVKGFSYYTPVSCTHFITSVNDVASRPLNFVVSPNPVRNNVTINFSIPLRTEAKLYLINALSETLNSAVIEKGETTKDLGVDYLASGIYFIRLQTDNGVLIEKFIKE